MDYFAFMKEEPVDHEGGRLLPGLRSVWVSTGTEERLRLVRTSDGEYNGQSALAWEIGKPMWIVGEAEEELEDASSYVDHWSKITEMPSFWATVDGVRTSILIPVKGKDRVLGVINMECKSYRRPSEVGKAELMRMAEALGILHELHEAHQIQAGGTAKAIEELQSILKSRRFPTRLSTPRLFFASSHRADEAVVEKIKEVIEEGFVDQLELVHWADMSAAGNITDQTLEAITTARFGICYLSEPAPDGLPHRYQDNPNVLFEAGMLHAYTNAPTERPRFWIPIREGDSSEAPFDFASERTIIPPRTDDDELDEEAFATELRRRVEALIDAD
ncbi:MAG: hypothetical protein IH943_12015 [Acidobacteria bacterium]|nr:hypothetical protein [Acidobacteriota bacterium]